VSAIDGGEEMCNKWVSIRGLLGTPRALLSYGESQGLGESKRFSSMSEAQMWILRGIKGMRN